MGDGPRFRWARRRCSTRGTEPDCARRQLRLAVVLWRPSGRSRVQSATTQWHARAILRNNLPAGVELSGTQRPLALAFPTGNAFPAEYRNDAFITMRGSWNRENPTGYKVVRLRFTSGQPARFEDFLTGWLSEDGLTAYGRPTGLAFHTDGSMLISDDHNGAMYRVSPGTPPTAADGNGSIAPVFE